MKRSVYTGSGANTGCSRRAEDLQSLTQSGQRRFKLTTDGDRRDGAGSSGVEKCGLLPISEERWEKRPSIGLKLREHAMAKTMAKNTICLWYDKDAEAAARFYAETFPDSAVGAVHRAPGDYPSGKKGDVLTVEFTVAGVACIGLNGGSAFKHSEAFSFQIATDDQAETDRYWNAIVGNGGQESACGWCKDKWGLSWQITPRVLTEAMAAGGDEAKRAFDAMMTMKKIDVAAIEAARRG
jgi:predicted 3-demethylubiquinone-9 3-methyltransferase (glyoxalase superfamily)